MAPGKSQTVIELRQNILQLTENGNHLYQQGRAQEALATYQQALQSVQQINWRVQKAILLNLIGTVYRNQGQFPEALSYYQQSLAIARSLSDRRLEGEVSSNIGVVYFEWDDYARAMDCYQQALAIAREVKSRRDEGIALNNMAAVYDVLGQYAQALATYEASLVILREVKYRQREGSTLNNLGNVYRHLNQPVKALASYQQALGILREVGDRRTEGILLTNIGTIHLDLGQFPAAVAILRQAVAVHRATHNRLDESTTLNNLAGAYQELGQYVQALEVYQQALAIKRAIKDRLAEGITFHNIGKVYHHLGDDALALDYAQQALAIAREVKSRRLEGTILTSIGASYLRTKNFTAAEKLLFAAVAIWESLRPGLADANTVSLFETQTQTYRYLQETLVAQSKFAAALEVAERGRARAFVELLYQRLKGFNPKTSNQRAKADLLLKTGNDYFDRQQFENALQNWQQALILYQELGDRSGEAITLINIGVIHDIQGRFARALEFYQQALAVQQTTGDRWGEGISLARIGTIYDALGQYDKALDYLQHSLSIHQEVGNRQGEAGTLTRLGMLHRHMEQYPRALSYHQQALGIRRELHDRLGEGANLMGIGAAYEMLGQHEKALVSLQESLVIRREVGDRQGEGTTLSVIGSFYLNRGQYEQALSFYQQALVIHHEVGNRPEEGFSFHNVGTAYFRLGKPEKAEKSLFDAISIWESLRADLTNENKVSLVDNVARLASSYSLLQQALVAQNKFASALEVAERGRTRAFVDLLEQRLGQSLQPTVLPITLAEIKQVAKAQNATLVEYSIIREEVGEVGQRKTWQDSKLYIWVISPTGQVTFRQVNLRPTRQPLAVPTPATMLTGSRSPDGLEQLVGQTRTSIRGGLGVTTGTDATPSTAARLPLDFTTAPEGYLTRKQLQQLHALLIAPIADLLPQNPTDHVIFMPQGSLFLVPFPALRDANGQYLIAKHTILTAPSIQVLAMTRQQWTRRSGQPTQLNQFKALIVGNPVMPSVSFAPGTPRYPLSPLPGTETEAKAIASLFHLQPILGKQATKVAIVQQMPHAQLIHLATHGILDDVHGLGSAIALAPSANDDGLLTAAEILEMKLQADLVVLSACNTGQGKITGDGVVGLSRSLISAGVPSVLVSLWAVPDAPTAELMTAFYQQLQRFPDKAQALRQAMLTIMETYPHPRDWAAFTLIGESAQ